MGSGIDTRLVCGFLNAGKTTYIQDCIFHDFFHKYGSVLILCFEEGEQSFDLEQLRKYRATVAFYEGNESIPDFCARAIADHQPDRVYVEMNAMIPELRQRLPDILDITFVALWMEWATLGLYMANWRQMIARMVSEAQQVTFRGCPSKELLAPYTNAFRLMNRKAIYLRQDPMGYHEKAFDLFLPYTLDAERIQIAESDYLMFCLDAADHPEHYDRKRLCFTDPVEVRRVDETVRMGRVVMTCCMADLQFMGFPLTGDRVTEGWITLEALGGLTGGRLSLIPQRMTPSKPSDTPILAAV